MQKFGLKTTKSKRARRLSEAEDEAEASLHFKVTHHRSIDTNVKVNIAISDVAHQWLSSPICTLQCNALAHACLIDDVIYMQCSTFHFTIAFLGPRCSS